MTQIVKINIMSFCQGCITPDPFQIGSLFEKKRVLPTLEFCTTLNNKLNLYALGELIRQGRWKVSLGHVGERWNCFYVHHVACISFTTLRLFTNTQSEKEAEF